jgi:hypothetical protein
MSATSFDCAMDWMMASRDQSERWLIVLGNCKPSGIRNAEHMACLKLRHPHSKHNMWLLDFASDFVAGASIRDNFE